MASLLTKILLMTLKRSAILQTPNKRKHLVWPLKTTSQENPVSLLHSTYQTTQLAGLITTSMDSMAKVSDSKAPMTNLWAASIRLMLQEQAFWFSLTWLLQSHGIKFKWLPREHQMSSLTKISSLSVTWSQGRIQINKLHLILWSWFLNAVKITLSWELIFRHTGGICKNSYKIVLARRGSGCVDHLQWMMISGRLLRNQKT